MSSDARPVEGSTEHTGSTTGAGRDGGVITEQVSTGPSSDVAETPIYDELAARFGLPRFEAEPRRAGAESVAGKQSAA